MQNLINSVRAVKAQFLSNKTVIEGALDEVDRDKLIVEENRNQLLNAAKTEVESVEGNASKSVKDFASALSHYTSRIKPIISAEQRAVRENSSTLADTVKELSRDAEEKLEMDIENKFQYDWAQKERSFGRIEARGKSDRRKVMKKAFRVT
jgi:hypothetical protein